MISLAKMIFNPSGRENRFGQGWRQEYCDWGLTLPTEELKYGSTGNINAKNL